MTPMHLKLLIAVIHQMGLVFAWYVLGIEANRNAGLLHHDLDIRRL